MAKLLSIIKYVLFGISILALVGVFTLGNNGVSLILQWAYVLLAIAILAALLFPLINLATNPKAALRTLMGIGIVAVVLIVAYALSNTDPMVLSDNTVYDDKLGLGLTDTGLYVTYIALAGAIIVAVFGEIRNSFK